MDKFWLQLPVWQQQNVTATWIECERLQCSQVTYKYIWKPFSKALVPKNRNKAGKAIMRAHRIFNTLFNLSSTDLANSGHAGSSKTWVQLPSCSRQPAGAAAHKTHTQHLAVQFGRKNRHHPMRRRGALALACRVQVEGEEGTTALPNRLGFLLLTTAVHCASLRVH